MASSTETTTTKNMVRLTSSDGEWFDVRAEAIGAASVTIGGMLEDGWVGDAIPVPNVLFDRDFINVGDDDVLFDIILAANYLNIQDLLDLACKAVAEVVRGKSPEELRKRFNIRNDYTQEEEVRRENSSAFE